MATPLQPEQRFSFASLRGNLRPTAAKVPAICGERDDSANAKTAA
jgi:hypothetical protein